MTIPPDDQVPLDDIYAGYDPKFEALQELSNIGVGHAATALSQLLNRKVDMSIPRINLVNIQDASKVLASSPEEIVAGIFLVSKEEDSPANLNMLLIFDEESVRMLLTILSRIEDNLNLTELDEISRSIIKETGNILLLNTITAINSFTESRWFPNSPDLAIDMIGSLTDEVLLADINEDEHGNVKVLLVECDVFTGDGKKLKGNILLLPNSEAMNVLMNRLYGEGWEVMF